MTNLRAHVVDALLNDHRAFWGFTPLRRKAMAQRTADVLLSLPGIGIVVLPTTKPWPHRCGLSFGTDVITTKGRVLVRADLDVSPVYARELAASLIAAANSIEEPA